MKSKMFLALAAMTSFLPLQQAFSMPIEQVYVQVVDITGGTSIPLLNKMSNSMQLVDVLFCEAHYQPNHWHLQKHQK